jgi:hypothetical protein
MTRQNSRPGELSTELDANPVILIIFFDSRSFDRLAIKENAVIFRDFADCTDNLFYVGDGRGAPAKQVQVSGGSMAPDCFHFELLDRKFEQRFKDPNDVLIDAKRLQERRAAEEHDVLSEADRIRKQRAAESDALLRQPDPSCSPFEQQRAGRTEGQLAGAGCVLLAGQPPPSRLQPHWYRDVRTSRRSSRLPLQMS